MCVSVSEGVTAVPSGFTEPASEFPKKPPKPSECGTVCPAEVSVSFIMLIKISSIPLMTYSTHTHARTHVFSPCCVCISCARCVSSALAVILSSTDQDPSLEIKYRPKKNKEKKETEAEREEKSDDESSSPPPKIDRRRISQVRRAFSEIFVKYTPNTTISEIGLSPLGTSGDD